MGANQSVVDIQIKICHDTVKLYHDPLPGVLLGQGEMLGVGGKHLGIVVAETVVGQGFYLMRQVNGLHASKITGCGSVGTEALTEMPVQIPLDFSLHK